MVSYYVLYSNCVCKMCRFGDTRLLKIHCSNSFGAVLWMPSSKLHCEKQQNMENGVNLAVPWEVQEPKSLYFRRKVIYTRKPSCRWQTRATLAKSVHSLRNSSGVVSCIARLPIDSDSVPMVSYYVLYSNCLSNASLWRYSPFKNTVTLKPGSGVTQGHRKWHHSIACIWFPITVL